MTSASNEFDGRSGGVASGVGQRVVGVVDGDDAGAGPVLATSASASAPEPVHRSTMTGRGEKSLRQQPIPAATRSPAAG